MPKIAKTIPNSQFKNLAHNPAHGDRPTSYPTGIVAGLYMQVTKSGSKSWFLRTKIGSRRPEIGLGGYPAVGVALAKTKALEVLEQIRQGIDPVQARKEAREALTSQGILFCTVMEQYLKGKLAEFDNSKHRKQWRATLDRYALPSLGNMPISDITVQHIQSTLEPIWHAKTETASRLRGRIENVLAYATVQGYRSGDNPARWKGNLDTALPKPSKIAKTVNQPALSLADATQWFCDLRARSGTATRALELLALTGMRSGEVRGLTWEEVDLKGGTITLPAQRMKANKEHRIPLTNAMRGLLSGLTKQDGTNYVFPAQRGGMLSDAALSACMKRIHEAAGGALYLDQRSGRPAVPHGIRSTFRDWAAELTDYPSAMAEISLAHSVGSDVERAYRRGDQLEKRRAMMSDWGQFLQGK
ncbi:tyrosine-type recombinase/integrase [Sulfitobacter sp.]|uniref:tyrosine-type recombinase/integrase n=1 Tax=Sulfitobacter sp. TaxID=1903071 RepID=UPI0032968B66